MATNDPKNTGPVDAIEENPADAGGFAQRPAVGGEYLVSQQTSQTAPLPEEIPSTLQTKEEAKRAASRKNVTQTFWSLVRHQFKKNKVAVFALYIVYFL